MPAFKSFSFSKTVKGRSELGGECLPEQRKYFCSTLRFPSWKAAHSEGSLDSFHILFTQGCF